MKKLIFIFLYFLPYALFAQDDFIQIGAEWHYGKGYGFSPAAGYDYFFVEKDTVINSKSCKKIVVKKYNELDQLINSFSFGMYKEDNKVFYTYHNEFVLLFDYSLNIGDTISLIIPKDYLELSISDTLFKGTLKSVSQTKICDSKISYYGFTTFGGAIFAYTDFIGLGGWYFFPFDSHLNDQILYSFRCYHDSTFDCTERQCDFTHPGYSEIKYQENSNKNINLKRKGNSIEIGPLNNHETIYIYDISGRQIFYLNNIYEQFLSIDLSGFAKNDIYILLVRDKSSLNTFKFIK